MPLIFPPCVKQKGRWAAVRNLGTEHLKPCQPKDKLDTVMYSQFQLQESSFCHLDSWLLLDLITLDFNKSTSSALLCLTFISSLWPDPIYIELWILGYLSACSFSVIARIVYRRYPIDNHLTLTSRLSLNLIPRLASWVAEGSCLLTSGPLLVLFHQHPAICLVPHLIDLCLLNTQLDGYRIHRPGARLGWAKLTT